MLEEAEEEGRKDRKKVRRNCSCVSDEKKKKQAGKNRISLLWPVGQEKVALLQTDIMISCEKQDSGGEKTDNS